MAIVAATFSQKLKRLEEIVSQLESSEVDLEEGLKLLEEGVSLHKECQSTLTKSQEKITQLLSNNATPEPATKSEKTEPVSDSLFDSIDASNDETPISDSELPF